MGPLTGVDISLLVFPVQALPDEGDGAITYTKAKALLIEACTPANDITETGIICFYPGFYRPGIISLGQAAYGGAEVDPTVVSSHIDS